MSTLISLLTFNNILVYKYKIQISHDFIIEFSIIISEYTSY